MSLDTALGVVEPLTDDDYEDRIRLERVVDQGLSAFVAVGTALGEIRDRRLYRSTDPTFVAYLKREWQMSESSGYRYIDAAAVTLEVSEAIEAADEDSPTGEAVPPQNEAQARELAKLIGQPEKAAQAMRLASEDGPPTAQKVRDAVKSITVTTVKTTTTTTTTTEGPGPDADPDPGPPPPPPTKRTVGEQKAAAAADRAAQNFVQYKPHQVDEITVKRLEAWCQKWRNQ